MNQRLKAALWMVASALSFAIMQVIVGETSDRIPLFQQLLFRNLIASGVAYVAIRKQSLPLFGTKGNRGLLMLRSIAGYLGMITMFYASGNADQGDVATISKMSPFVVSVLAFIFLKEKITRYQMIGLAVAFTGAYFVSNPQYNSNIFPIFVALLACLFSGIAYTLVSALKGRESPEVIIFVFSAFSTVMTFPVMLMNYVIPSPSDFILLLCIGLFAAFGQILLTYSYSLAKASEVSIYNYSGIIFSMILGYLFLGQTVAVTSFVGAVLVILAGCIVFFGNRSLERKNHEK